MIGGLLGFVGLGKVNGSQKTTPLEALLTSLGMSTSSLVLSELLLPLLLLLAPPLMIELCDTPVE